MKGTSRVGPWIAGKEHVYAEDNLFISIQISDLHRSEKLGLRIKGGPSQILRNERSNRVSIINIAEVTTVVVDFNEDNLSESNSWLTCRIERKVHLDGHRRIRFGSVGIV
jgi:hypothetical protein